jgi:hypothetical protein
VTHRVCVDVISGDVSRLVDACGKRALGERACPGAGGIEGNEGASGFTTWWLGDWMGERLSTGLGFRLGSGVRVKLLRWCFPGERWK